MKKPWKPEVLKDVNLEGYSYVVIEEVGDRQEPNRSFTKVASLVIASWPHIREDGFRKWDLESEDLSVVVWYEPLKELLESYFPNDFCPLNPLIPHTFAAKIKTSIPQNRVLEPNELFGEAPIYCVTAEAITDTRSYVNHVLSNRP